MPSAAPAAANSGKPAWGAAISHALTGQRSATHERAEPARAVCRWRVADAVTDAVCINRSRSIGRDVRRPCEVSRLIKGRCFVNWNNVQGRGARTEQELSHVND